MFLFTAFANVTFVGFENNQKHHSTPSMFQLGHGCTFQAPKSKWCEMLHIKFEF